ncbi:DDE-type integrase/transposase/recombinase, partial [Shigella sonnei]|uniref:DDE-type integrase/transposase/recombinase n=1 Tax=Shigella sonnei TaxID=624 RepID=UPI0011D03AD3
KAVAAGDRVNRQFVAERPDQLWVADFTYVSTWRGFVYVAFIIDVFAGYIVGWRVSSSMDNRRLLERLGHIPPAEAEKAYYASIGNDDLAA